MRTFEEIIKDSNRRSLKIWNKKLCQYLYGKDAKEMEKLMSPIVDVLSKHLKATSLQKTPK